MSAGKSGKSKKHDRNRKWCEAYRSRGQRDRNKARRLAKHIKRVPWDAVARRAFEGLSATARKGLDIPPPALCGPAEARRLNDLTLTMIKREARGLPLKAPKSAAA